MGWGLGLRIYIYLLLFIGELPWVKNDKSTWQRIKSTQNDMVTHFLTLKGEKVINTVSLLNNLYYLSVQSFGSFLFDFHNDNYPINFLQLFIYDVSG